MPRPGGPRQGAPGRSYPNRSDLNVRRAPQTGTNTAAAGGIATPGARVTSGPPSAVPAPLTPDQVPKLDDPSGRPGEPLTTGLPTGPGAGPEGIGPLPPSPAAIMLAGAYQAYPSDELRRAVMWLVQRGLL